MALEPLNENHALQIQAGILGRKGGHDFEKKVVSEINQLQYPISVIPPTDHLLIGDPALLLLHYISSCHGIYHVENAVALSTGALATSEEGKKWLEINGERVKRCKSDLIVTITSGHREVTVGVSIKQSNNTKSTNAQLYFTTAQGFSNLLIKSGFEIPLVAIESLRQFCGDPEYRPIDNQKVMENRNTDPRRYFWEEINQEGRNFWENLLQTEQEKITRLLLQKAYIDDPFVPEFLMHKTSRSSSWSATEVALYMIDELVALSRNFQGFITKPYSVRKGSNRDPQGVKHLAPRFGVVQMQRGGQKQHPEQLQFNLESGYFYKI